MTTVKEYMIKALKLVFKRDLEKKLKIIEETKPVVKNDVNGAVSSASKKLFAAGYEAGYKEASETISKDASEYLEDVFLSNRCYLVMAENALLLELKAKLFLDGKETPYNNVVLFYYKDPSVVENTSDLSVVIKSDVDVYKADHVKIVTIDSEEVIYSGKPSILEVFPAEQRPRN